jgi:hypothetical protein
MSDSHRTLKSIVLKEAALFLGLFLAGIVLLPTAIYVVGQAFFGEYGGNGFADFYARLHYELRSGQPVSWYLVLTPYFCWQLFRLSIWGFRNFRKAMPAKRD